MQFLSFNDFLNKIKSTYQDQVAISTLGDNGFYHLTYSELVGHSFKLAKILSNKSIGKGDRVAIMLPHGPWWPVYAFAVFLCGATLIPLDTALMPGEIKNLLDFSRPKLLICNDDLLDKLSQISHPSFTVLIYDPKSIINFSELKHITLQEVKNSDLALIVFTSGTSGSPKGVMLSFNCLLLQLNSLYSEILDKNIHRTLSVLPINHMFEFSIGLCLPLACGLEIVVAKSLDKEHLLYCLKEKKINQMIAVPLLCDFLYKGIKAKIEDLSTIKKFLFSFFLIFCKFTNSLQLKLFLFKKIHDSFGGHFIRFIAGGAASNEETISFFNNIGINIYEGYGLTETGPVISTNTPKNYKIGTTGKCISSIECRIDRPDEHGVGEVIVNGLGLFSGYLDNEEETKEVLKENGDFHTGDLGLIDSDGFLKLTGRLKKLIVLPGGKKVFPEEVESILKTHRALSDAFVFSIELNPQQVIIIAAVIPLLAILGNKNKPDFSEFKKSLLLEVHGLYEKITPFKRPHKTIVLESDLPRTTTKKIKLKEAKEIVTQLLKQNGLI